MDIRELYRGLKEYRYTDEDIAMLFDRNSEVELVALLDAIRESCLRSSDPNWKKWQIDEKYPSMFDEELSQHILICKDCGGPLFFINGEFFERRGNPSFSYFYSTWR